MSPILATIDPWILAFSAVTVIATIWLGFWAAKKSKTASDFYVAGRSVSVGWNASAISGEYLSAASFMGVAGMVMSSGYDALWYPVCYACGYLFLLLFIAGPLRRFGAYTVPDLAEGRFDSPLFRKIAVVFVLFIGFFYTMPQMKGAGTTLAYIFPGLPYWVGVALVGAVITLNVALGGMKGITLVQAFQYWAKMFAISVPIFVLMAVYGNYGKQLGVNAKLGEMSSIKPEYLSETNSFKGAGIFLQGNPKRMLSEWQKVLERNSVSADDRTNLAKLKMSFEELSAATVTCNSGTAITLLTKHDSRQLWIYQTAKAHFPEQFEFKSDAGRKPNLPLDWFQAGFEKAGFSFIGSTNDLIIVPTSEFSILQPLYNKFGLAGLRCHQLVQTSEGVLGLIEIDARREVAANFGLLDRLKFSWQKLKFRIRTGNPGEKATPFALMAEDILFRISDSSGDRLLVAYELLESQNPDRNYGIWVQFPGIISHEKWAKVAEGSLETNGIVVSDGALPIKTNRCVVISDASRTRFVLPVGRVESYARCGLLKQSGRQALPEKAPADSTWLSPFGPLTTKAAKTGLAVDLSPRQSELLNTNRYFVYQPSSWEMGWRPSVLQRVTRPFSEFGRRITGQKYSASGIASLGAAMRIYSEFSQSSVHFEKSLTNAVFQSVTFSAKSRTQLLREFDSLAVSNGVALVSGSDNTVWAVPAADAALVKSALRLLEAKARPVRLYALLYTYSLIIALVCGTAGLPHILVRFYTNPDGVAAKRTTMWVMILIGTFYLFPPIFGVMGRNLLPELYNGVGAKGTDKVVLELPRILNSHSPTDSLTHSRGEVVSEKVGESVSGKGLPWGSILSGVTCAGAFAAFMSTFSGLLVSMTGAMAHDVYGRMLNPKATGPQRLRAFKIAAVIIGAIAIVLGTQVETLEINFMVGQAFAIAAASYFPFLFMCAWWRNLTMKGAATGMLTGGLLALAGITLTSISDIALKTSLAKGTPNPLQGLQEFWAGHPGIRIICEQPAIWAVPLAIGLMVVVSKLTRSEVPKDIRMKMLVLHAPEKLGLKQEYIQEHQHH